MKPTVVVNMGKDNFPEDVAATLEPLADVVYAPWGQDEEYLGEARAVVVGGGRIDDSYLDKTPNIGLVARFGVGYDSVDVEACTRRRVWATHTPGVLSRGVADHTWALILGYLHWIPMADRYTREEWAHGRRRVPFGWEVEGKTLGLLGLGRIGTEVVKRAQGFGAKVIYHDVVRRPDLEAEHGVEYVGFEELLEASDILTIHVPLLPSTRGIIGERELELMKPTAVIVNTSRGPVIDEAALIEALKTGKVGGAALDVFEEEPTPLDNPLLEMENVVLAPHLGSAMWETRRKMAVCCADNVKAFLEGKKLPNVVPEQRDVTF